ncbi:MSP domain-containing protein VAP, partial [Aphelenchoides avenae]
MAAKTQVLQLEPNNEISFKGPFTEVVTSQLKLRNPADRPVFFKVKTTAPRFYCVRPNSGVVKPGDTANIAVMLQPVDQAATLESERTRHKFMIQTAFAPDADTPVDTFWKTADLSQ